MSDNVCQYHSGIKVDIDNLKLLSSNHQDQINKLDARIDSIIIRLNVVLSSILVATLALVANLFVKIV